MRSTVTLSALLLTLTACDNGPEPQLSHASARLQCGPADEPFTAIVLAAAPIGALQPPFPHATFMLPAGVNTLAGTNWDIDPKTLPAFYVTGLNKSEAAVSGHVSITSVDAANTVVGSVSLRFPSRFIETPFTAPYLFAGPLCP